MCELKIQLSTHLMYKLLLTVNFFYVHRGFFSGGKFEFSVYDVIQNGILSHTDQLRVISAVFDKLNVFSVNF